MPTSTPTPRPRPAAARPGKTSAKASAPAKIPAAAKATKPSARATRPSAKPAAAKARTAAAPARASKPSAPAKAAKPAKPAAKATRPAKSAPAKAPAPPAAGPAVQAPAPDFQLAADDGRTYSLAGLKGTRFVLYFYPRDSTPGCTTEACDFRDRHATFLAAKIPVLGVSGDSLASHTKFRGKYQLPFPLLSDPDNRVAAAFGAFGEKTMYGRKMQGIIRSTFVIGPTGLIEAAWRPVKVPGHAEAVLQVIRGTR